MAMAPEHTGIGIRRHFTSETMHPYDEVTWERRDARISNYRDGTVAFEQPDVEFPVDWSLNATNIVAQKYFRGPLGTPERESSLRQVIDRVADTITEWGRRGGYFVDDVEAETFRDELKHLVVTQKAAFNSPVWFNIGVAGEPAQASACFILAVEDTMRSILNWYVEEGTIFKGGSGSGINLSTIRSSAEQLKGGGTASGPVSFMRGADASAGTIKSGGKTRRAAKMVILNADHPDVEDFIWCKAVEERKARALSAAGFDMDLDGRDSHSIQYQNANNSVRVTDEFMQAVLDDADWHLRAVTTGAPVRTVKARQLFRQIAEATWECADPGMQFDTTINRWHTASNTGPITASNPCSEYMHLDNSACNLASLNLLRFLDLDGTFDVVGFKAAVEVVFTAQEILVGSADYPTEKIGDNARRFRQLGLGYANLGAMLMAQGVPYDSDEGRAWASSITSLMTGHAYATSARTAARMGPFAGYMENREPINKVLRMHRDAVATIDTALAPAPVLEAAKESWDRAVEWGELHGVRNAQASVLAPTGCLAGGSLVATDRGLVRLRSLGDPEGPQWQDIGLTVQTDEGPRSATRFYVNRLEPVVEAVTRRGYRLRGTTLHRVKVVDESGTWAWRRLADLRPGDMVPLALDQLVGEPATVGLPRLGESMRWAAEHAVRTPAEVDAELAELVGYFMGDGSLHAKGLRLCVSDGDDDVVAHLCLLAKSLFGIEAAVRPAKGYTSVELDSVRLASWWDACGFAKRCSSERRRGKGWLPHVPDAVLHTNDRSVYAAFLRGLFEADGTVRVGYPSWTTTTGAFASEVQTLLLALGFVTTRSAGVSGRGSPSTIVCLLDKAVNRRWVDDIGFISARKHRALDLSDGPRARHDHIPVSRALVDRVAPANDRLGRAARLELSRSGTITRRLASELHERSADTELGHLLGFFYDRLVSAELVGEELTYDLSVPDNLTYVANGFVSHNTIGLMMDCDTTGIEPDLGLCKTKKLVGGGTMSIVNQTVPRALAHLGYTPAQVAEIVAHIDQHKSILGAPHLSADHLAVFACSMGDNVIHYLGHVRMMAAVQPWISGAISKCVVGPTLVTTADGLVRMGSLHAGEAPGTFRPEVLEVASLDGTRKTDAFYYGGVKPVRRAVLGSGHSIVGTERHRLLVAGPCGLEWRRLDELAVGDEVAVAYGADLWSPLPAVLGTPDGPAEMSPELAFLLGACAAAGEIDGAAGTVTVTGDIAVLGRVVDAWRAVLDVEARIDEQRPTPAAVVHSTKAVELLVWLGRGAGAPASRVPDTVLRSQRDDVLAFLQGLSIAAVPSTDRPEWSIRSASLGLLDDVSVVLTNLGVVHSRRSAPASSPGVDELFVTGAEVRRLIELVPFVDPAKAEVAARMAPTSEPEAPAEGEDVGRPVGDPGELFGMHLSPVVAVGDEQAQEVFDLSVPSTHAYVANGIVSHNTINMPEQVTVEEVEQLHIDAWRLGLKAVAIYRDNCKVAQPLATTKKETAPAPAPVEAERVVQTVVVKQPVREKLPRRRRSKTMSFRVADCHGYVIVGEYDDGRPGEIFLKVAKQGSTLAGIMDAFAISVSHGLQYGVPLKAFVDMYTNMRFEPAGMTDDPDIRFASSLIDYIFRRLAVEYLPYEDRAELGILTVDERRQPTLPGVEEHVIPTSSGVDIVPDPADVVLPGAPSETELVVPMASDAPYCYQCGMVMQRAGACFVCASCGTTSGCS